MVDSGLLIIVVLIIVIIIFILFAVYTRPRPPPSSSPVDPSIYTNQYNGFAFWGKDVPAPGGRGVCQLYNFPATVSPNLPDCGFGCSPVCEETILSILGQPTVNADIVDTLTPSPVKGCINVDQVVLKKVIRTCTTLPGSTTLSQPTPDSLPLVPLIPSTSLATCTALDGTKVPIGGTETYYTSDKCGATSCGGILGLFAVGYGVNPDVNINPPCAGTLCLSESISTNTTFSLIPCAITDESQLFYFTRVNGQAIPSKSGIFTQINKKTSTGVGSCITASPDRTTLAVDDTCKLSWLFLPQLNGELLSSPQQTIFIGDLTGVQIDNILNAVSADAAILLLADYGVKSIQEYTPILLRLFRYYATNDSTPTTVELNRKARTMYVDYTISNSVLFTSTLFTFAQ